MTARTQANRPPSSRLRIRRAFVATLVVLFGGLAAAQPAAAFEKAIWGPPQVNGVSQFPIYQDLGVDLYQYYVNWQEIAPEQPANPTDPNDPAYRWPADLDLAARETSARGMGMLVMTLRTPGWSNGWKANNVPPTDPDQYAMFMEALAKRYPSVRYFMVWGEPIRGDSYDLHPVENRNYFAPGGRPKNEKLPTFTPALRRDARGYATLVDTTYARLKALNSKNKIIGGNTTTSGDVDPFNWAKWMRLKNGKPPRMDMFGHNPFGTRGPDLKKDQIIVGTADMSDLDVFIPWVEKYQRRSGRNKSLKLFVSEYTAPVEVRSYEFSFFVTPKLQATWLTAAMNIAKRDKDIFGLGWIGLYDQAMRSDGTESRTGLIAPDGTKRPSYYAFKRA